MIILVSQVTAADWNENETAESALSLYCIWLLTCIRIAYDTSTAAVVSLA